MGAPVKEVLTTSEMARADALAIAAGVSGAALMERAGAGVANAARQMVPPGARVAVLCGPGNNGGDGFVAAQLLAARGYDVRLGLLGAVAALKGDAAAMAARWNGAAGEEVSALDADLIDGADLIIDALFGAGLARPLDGAAADIAQAVKRRRQHGRCKILAVDVPSGLNGDTGMPLGKLVLAADRTVTFFRSKPGHLLMPGRVLCGDVELIDIGIGAAVLDEIKPQTFVNGAPVWPPFQYAPALAQHKYKRGAVLVLSGPAHATGAARLAANGALRVGAGVVSVASPPDAVAVNAAHLTSIMIKPFQSIDGFGWLLKDARLRAVVIGPGCGVGDRTQDMVLRALATNASVVLDADALSSFMAGFPAHTLFAAITDRAHGATVLTPHEGEFIKLFGRFDAGISKLERARIAAQRSGAIIVLKGADTVIAAPDGRAVINDNAPAGLATAGSGDVVAGFIAGLLAQGAPGFVAACAAVWLHGACGAKFGPGLIAEDLPEQLPQVLRDLANGDQAGVAT